MKYQSCFIKDDYQATMPDSIEKNGWFSTFIRSANVVKHHSIQNAKRVLLGTALLLGLSTQAYAALDLTVVRGDIASLKVDSKALLSGPAKKDLISYLNSALNAMNKAVTARENNPTANISSKLELAGSMMDEYTGNLTPRIPSLLNQATAINQALILLQDNDFTGLTLLIGDPIVGKTSFTDQMCYLCHGNDGSGGPAQIVIQGKIGSAIVLAMATELVHSGVLLDDEQQAYDIAAFLANPTAITPPPLADFSKPEVCATCHPRQFKEWQGNMMTYSAISPVFTSLEVFGNKIPTANHPEGANRFARTMSNTIDPATGKPENPAGDVFCQSCHNPIDANRDYPLGFELAGPGENPFPVKRDDADLTPNVIKPLRDFDTEVGRRGLSCDYCHQVTGPDLVAHLPTQMGDGIANVSINFKGGIDKQGPIVNPLPNPVHGSISNPYLSSSNFCGGCHDVRLTGTDEGTGEPFSRLEDLFTEWKNGPYGPTGSNTSCQDCHMSLFPASPPGTYPQDITNVYPRPAANTEKRVSTHYFTGVDVALNGTFPGQDPEGRDAHGQLIGQSDRRGELLQAAATMTVTAPASIMNGDTLPIDVAVTNVGAGHNIPSGFSQERQMWIELMVKDSTGAEIYKSGYLVDSAHPETGEIAPDGNLNDEDLQNLSVVLGGPEKFGATQTISHGPDYNERHADPPINEGLVNFGNEFVSVIGGHVEEEFIPFAANLFDNTFSIPPLATRTNRYDVHLPANAVGPISVQARLLFRPLPPRFIRFLAEQTAGLNLLDEAVVDRNKIIEMVGPTTASVTVTP